MEEKAYKVMGITGGLNITLGILAIVAGVAGGVLLIVGGGRLLAAKSNLCFSPRAWYEPPHRSHNCKKKTAIYLQIKSIPREVLCQPFWGLFLLFPFCWRFI